MHANFEKSARKSTSRNERDRENKYKYCGQMWEDWSLKLGTQLGCDSQKSNPSGSGSSKQLGSDNLSYTMCIFKATLLRDFLDKRLSLEESE